MSFSTRVTAHPPVLMRAIYGKVKGKWTRVDKFGATLAMTYIPTGLDKIVVESRPGRKVADKRF